MRVDGRSGIAGTAEEEEEEEVLFVATTELFAGCVEGPIGVERALLVAPAPALSHGLGGETVAMLSGTSLNVTNYISFEALPSHEVNSRRRGAMVGLL